MKTITISDDFVIRLTHDVASSGRGPAINIIGSGGAHLAIDDYSRHLYHNRIVELLTKHAKEKYAANIEERITPATNAIEAEFENYLSMVYEDVVLPIFRKEDPAHLLDISHPMKNSMHLEVYVHWDLTATIHETTSGYAVVTGVEWKTGVEETIFNHENSASYVRRGQIEYHPIGTTRKEQDVFYSGDKSTILGATVVRM